MKIPNPFTYNNLELVGNAKNLKEAIEAQLGLLFSRFKEVKANRFLDSSNLLEKWALELEVKKYPYLTDEELRKKLQIKKLSTSTMSAGGLNKIFKLSGFDVLAYPLNPDENPSNNDSISNPNQMSEKKEMSVMTTMMIPTLETFVNGKRKEIRPQYEEIMGDTSKMGSSTMGKFLGYEEVVIEDLQPDNNQDTWSYWFIIAGESRQEEGKVPLYRKEEFLDLLSEFKAAHMGVILKVRYT